MNILKLREDFPILNNTKKPLIYFDSACMALKPRQVIAKMQEYYQEYPACAGRSHHAIGRRATEEYVHARTRIQKFIHAKSEKEIIFTKNTTEGINLVAKSLAFDAVITTDKEHNSNVVPWLQAKSTETHSISHTIISTATNFEKQFDIATFQQKISEYKKQGKRILVSMHQTSNLDGTSIPVKDIIKIAHEQGALVMIDGAQSVPHIPTDVKKSSVDLLVFSGHKMLGPTGTGVLYGKEEVLTTLRPFMTGGDTVKDTTYETVTYEDIPEKFEAGLQDYAGIIGLGAAVDYLQKYIDDIENHTTKLNKIMSEGLHDAVDILGPQDPKLRGGICSFTAKNKMDHHEIALLLDSSANIAIRSGQHCVHSWFNANKIAGSARASTYLYNTEEEAQTFVNKTKEILRMKK